MFVWTPSDVIGLFFLAVFLLIGVLYAFFMAAASVQRWLRSKFKRDTKP